MAGGDSATSRAVIGPYPSIRYSEAEDVFRLYDPRLPIVAARVIALIREHLPDSVIEHIGSSAIPGCDGKGVVDVMVLFEPGGLGVARSALESMGFVRYTAAHAHPEERPVLLGSIVDEGEVFRLHVHVIPSDAVEVADQRRFREVLRANPALVAEYVEVKRRAVEAGVEDSSSYNALKDAFIKRVMSQGS